MSEQFLSEVDLAARWAMSSKTLTRWRGKRRGPPFVKLGKTIRYAMSDVLEFERHGLRKPLNEHLCRYSMSSLTFSEIGSSSRPLI